MLKLTYRKAECYDMAFLSMRFVAEKIGLASYKVG